MFVQAASSSGLDHSSGIAEIAEGVDLLSRTRGCRGPSPGLALASSLEHLIPIGYRRDLCLSRICTQVRPEMLNGLQEILEGASALGVTGAEFGASAIDRCDISCSLAAIHSRTG